MNWAVWRQDDAGNKFLVAENLTEEQANKLVEEYEARGHKQVYWATSNDENAPTST